MANRIGGTYLQTSVLRPITAHKFDRDPTTYDVNFSLLDEWLNETNSFVFQLVSLANPGAEFTTQLGVYATWVQIWPAGGGGGGFDALITQTGNVIPAGGVINVIAGSNINTAAVPPDGNNLQINLDNVVTITGNFTTTAGNVNLNDGSVNIVNGDMFLPFSNSATGVGYILWDGDAVITIPSVNNNFFGYLSGNPSTAAMVTATNNLGTGDLTLAALTSGSYNTAAGSEALQNINTGSSNTSLGYASLNSATSASNNTAVGSASSSVMTTGSQNITIGYRSGQAYTSESNNIALGNVGVALDENIMRLGGGTGVGAGEQDETYISGISGNVLAGTVGVMVINTATGGGGTIDNVGIVELQVAGYVLTSTGTTTPPAFMPGGGGGGSGGILTTIYDTPGSYTWTKNANTQFIEVYMWGAGGGGAGGNSLALSAPSFGGNGGDGGGFAEYSFPVSYIGATATVVVGSGGIGGAGVTSGLGGIGTNGGNTYFGGFNPPNGGLSGGAATLAAGPFVLSDSNANVITAYGTASIAIAQGPGIGAFGNNPQPAMPTGFFSKTILTLGSSSPSLWGKGGLMGSGGGAGGTAGSYPTNAGSIGGNVLDFQNNVLIAGGIGGNISLSIPAGNGNDNDGTFGGPLTGGTGGGGGGANASGTVSGNGGNGGYPGGAGGGGGASATGNISGSGGNGANGKIIVVEFFG